MSQSPQLERAKALISIQRYGDALALLGPLVAAEPNDVEALCLVAQCQLGLDQPARARTAARTAIQLAPGSEWAHRLLSISAARLGNVTEARSAARTAVQLAPGLWLSHQQLANVDLDAQVVTATTEDSARRAVELAPDQPTAHITLGRVALVQKDNRAAAAAFRAALRLDPANSAARNNLAVVLMRRRRLISAARHFTGALRIAPNSPLFAANLRNVLRVWAGLLDLFGVAGCVTILATTSGHDVTHPPPPGSAVEYPSVTLPSGLNLPSGIDLPASWFVSPEFPQSTVQHIPDLGWPAPLLAVVGVEVGILLLVMVSIRIGIGPRTARIVAHSLRVDRALLVMVVSCLLVIALMIAAAAAGLPAARPLVVVGLVTGALATWATRGVRRRAARRR